jgi:hypothetical protein
MLKAIVHELHEFHEKKRKTRITQIAPKDEEAGDGVLRLQEE